MKYYVLLTILITLIAVPLFALASDITGADYQGDVQIINTGSSATNVAANFTLNTAALITAGQLSANASNIVARDDGGNTIPIMPGYGANPWIVFYDSVLAGVTRQAHIYTGNVSGGDIDYFPGSTGMSVPDGMTEPSNNFTLSLTNTLLDTPGANKTLASHTDNTNGGLYAIVDPVTIGKIDLFVLGTTGWFLNYLAVSSQYCNKAAAVVSPVGANITIEAMIKPSTLTGTYQSIVFDGNLAGFNAWSFRLSNAQQLSLKIGNAGGTAWACDWVQTVGSVSLGSQHFLTAVYDSTAPVRTIVYVDGVAVTGVDVGAGGNINQPNNNLAIGAIYTGTYGFFFNGDIDEVRITQGVRTLADHLSFYNSGLGKKLTADASVISLYHFDDGAGDPIDTMGNNNLIRAGGAAAPSWIRGGVFNVTAMHTYSGVTFVNHNIILGLYSGNLVISVDGVLTSTAFAGVIPNSTASWQLAGSGIIYSNQITYNQGGMTKGQWSWRYGATFMDLSGNGNTAIPNFRTTCNYPSIISTLISFLPTSQSVASQEIISEWPDMITSVPTALPSMYTENGHPGLFFEPLIRELLGDGSTLYSLFWYVFAFGTVLLTGWGVFYFLASKGANGLFVKCIAMDVVMIIWALPGPNIYGMYVVIYKVFWDFGILVLSRNFGW